MMRKRGIRLERNKLGVKAAPQCGLMQPYRAALKEYGRDHPDAAITPRPPSPRRRSRLRSATASRRSSLRRLGTESLLTLPWRELDSKFQFLDFRSSIFYTAPELGAAKG